MRLILILIIIITSYQIKAQAQEEDSIKKSIDLDETVVSAYKIEELKRQVASQITVLTAKQIQFSNPQTAADIIAGTGQIVVQKSQQGGGSPIIRGFEASRILLVVDGVRMNNIIYRSGHLQNIISIDPSMLSKVEVLYGPSSTIYGSDALGGTIHFVTKKPILNTNEKKPITFNFMKRYASVNKGNTTHLNFNVGFKKMAFLTSISVNNFDDLRMGKNKNFFYDSLFGLRTIYIQHINGTDSIIKNKNQYLQTQSGYGQMDLMQKILFKPIQNMEHIFNFQYSNSTNIPRYDRLTDPMRNASNIIIPNTLNFAEWYYGPQTRSLAAYDFNISNKFGFSAIHIGASHQAIQESRVERKFKSANLDTRIENVKVIGYNLDFQKNYKKSKLRFGFDGQANKLKSTAFRSNIKDGNETGLSTRYPDGNNTLNHNAIYINMTYSKNFKLIINGGLRVGLSKLKSTINTNYFNLPVTHVAQNNSIRSGYLGLVYNPNKNLKLAYSVSSGFRVPNVDDLSKIFDTKVGAIIIPNPNLKPEQTLTNEIGIGAKPIKKLKLELSFWNTQFANAISLNNAQLNGTDSLMYGGTMSKIFTNKNNKKAELWGYSINIIFDICKTSQIYANLSYTKGIIKSIVPHIPLDHIAPISGNMGYLFLFKKLNIESYINFNGRKLLQNYNLNGEDNIDYTPANGLPAWATLNIKAGYKWKQNITLQGGIENILDTNYRVFASGINAPGRNFYLALRFLY